MGETKSVRQNEINNGEENTRENKKRFHVFLIR